MLFQQKDLLDRCIKQWLLENYGNFNDLSNGVLWKLQFSSKKIRLIWRQKKRNNRTTPTHTNFVSKAKPSNWCLYEKYLKITTHKRYLKQIIQLKLHRKGNPDYRENRKYALQDHRLRYFPDLFLWVNMSYLQISSHKR